MLNKLSSIEFTLERYDKALTILRNEDVNIIEAAKRYAIGWCNGMDVCVPSFQRAIMFEDSEGNKTWFHCPESIIKHLKITDEMS
ncbi:MAG: hypothetical protein ABFD25_03395 [Clostridiaceae bacterium]